MLPSLLDNIGTIYEASKSSCLLQNYTVCVPTSAVRLTEKLKYASQFQLGDIEEKKNMLGH